MSPNNPIANWDQISVWYISSVPGANTEMYLVTFLYLLQCKGTGCWQSPSSSGAVIRRHLL